MLVSCYVYLYMELTPVYDFTSVQVGIGHVSPHSDINIFTYRDEFQCKKFEKY